MTLVKMTPVRAGDIMRSGHRIHWEEFGAGDQTVLLLPTWSIVHSDHWRHQVAAFADTRRVITFDGLGNGSSDRPEDPSLYGDLSFADDGAAVLDACGVASAVVMGSSRGGVWALAMAARHPERVRAVAFIAPNVPLAPGHPARVAASETFLEDREVNDGWQMWNRSFWLHHYPEFLRFFFSQCFTEPDSAAEIQHFWEMGMQTTPEVLLATSGDGSNHLSADLARSYAVSLGCPSLVIHGDEDAISPLSRVESWLGWLRQTSSSCPGAATSRIADHPCGPTR